MANLYRRKQSGKSTHKRNVEPSNVDDKDKALHTPGSKSAAIETALRKQDEDESARWKRARELQDNIIATILVWVPMLGLIFGGCCSNVFALEAIVKDEPASGTLITFTQFLFATLFTLPQHVSVSSKHIFLKARAIPLRIWLIYTAFFVSINLLNNFAFNYKISVPLHIILRSAGPVTTMGVGYFYGRRRFTPTQVFSVILLTFGVFIAALADAEAKGKSITVGMNEGTSASDFLTGVLILLLALFLSSFMGVFSDRMYSTYGRDHGYEALFYSHTLSLPVFLVQHEQLSSQFRALLSSTPYTPPWTGSSWPLTHRLLSYIPSKAIYLGLNGLTQYACICGVSLLSARSSSLTVTIILNIRKLASLLLSIYIFGNNLAPGVAIGAGVVFLGGLLYGFEGARLKGSQNHEQKVKEAAKKRRKSPPPSRTESGWKEVKATKCSVRCADAFTNLNTSAARRQSGQGTR